VLAAPAAALAREPVISYVDENGVFRLYDEEAEAEVNPPPPVPANFAAFRYAVSQNGRFVFFNDAAKKLHLLDRATNTAVPLPGIDVYTNPQRLSVSDDGLLAFDENREKQAAVYSTATGQFVETGLPAGGGGHRHTRLSGDGHLLGTTCLTTCVVSPGTDSDAYIQNLVSKTDTAFPDSAFGDEENPCLDGDGSVFGVDRQTSNVVMQHDIILFDRTKSPPEEIAIDGVNGLLTSEVGCVLDASGDYLGFSDQATGAFKLYRVSTKTFVTLPSDKEFNEFSMLSAPYSPPPPPGGGPGGGTGPTGPTGDRTKPVVSRYRMAHRRFRVRRRATSFRFTLSEPARMRIVIRRLGKKVGEIRRRGLAAGAHTISFSGKLGRRKLKRGSYVAVLIATDRAGNVSLPVLIEFKVLRPKQRRR
jgi:hypothetical protein